MPRPSKGLTKRITLRMSALDDTIIKQTQQRLAEAGVTLSENDTILFLIQCATIPQPMTTQAARAAIESHWTHCTQCTEDAPPRCAAGLYLRDCYTLVRQAEDARATAPAPPTQPRQYSGLANHIRAFG